MENTESEKSILELRNVRIHNRRTSLRLEPTMWEAIDEILNRENMTIHQLCTHIHDIRRQIEESTKRHSSLTSALRMFIVIYYRKAATETGHVKAGHGSGSLQSLAQAMEML